MKLPVHCYKIKSIISRFGRTTTIEFSWKGDNSGSWVVNLIDLEFEFSTDLYIDKCFRYCLIF